MGPPSSRRPSLTVSVRAATSQTGHFHTVLSTGKHGQRYGQLPACAPPSIQQGGPAVDPGTWATKPRGLVPSLDPASSGCRELQEQGETGRDHHDALSAAATPSASETLCHAEVSWL